MSFLQFLVTTASTMDQILAGGGDAVLYRAMEYLKSLFAFASVPMEEPAATAEAHAFFSPIYIHYYYQNQWVCFLPWGFALLAGLILPIILFQLTIVERVRQRRYPISTHFGMEGSGFDPYWFHSPKKYRHWNTKTLEKEDLDMASVSATMDRLCATKKEGVDDGHQDDDDDVLLWKLPAPGHALAFHDDVDDGRLREKPTTRTVLGLCAICLDSYKLGEDVVWSSNENCVHVFHEHCMLSWLVRKRKRNQCPCCRQAFVQIQFKS